MHEKRRYKLIIYYFLQFVFAHSLLIYLFLQHVTPICQEALVHFELRNYYKILKCVLRISVPCSYIWLCVFFGLFHSWTNFWGEVTRFSDRRFYSDWWNAGSLAEYWRKWNYPIHNWLVRHIYFMLVRRGFNGELARFLTFTVSAVLHEYIVICIFRKCTMLAFTLMIGNIPLIQLQKALRGTLSKNMNNNLFWIVYTIIGQPFGIALFYYLGMRHTLYEPNGVLFGHQAKA